MTGYDHDNARVASTVVHTLFGLSGYAHRPPSGYAPGYAPGYRERLIGNHGEKMGVNLGADVARRDTTALPVRVVE